MALAQKMQIRQGLRQSQTLAMTPQLQQAIKLLQFSSFELSEYIDTQIEANPLLKKEEPDASEGLLDVPVPEVLAGELKLDDSPAAASVELDAPREDAYPEAERSLSGLGYIGNQFSGADIDLDTLRAAAVSLPEFLRRQLELSGLSQSDAVIGRALIDATDNDGFLRSDPAELAELLGAGEADILRVLEICHDFEPAGVMARNVQECLSLQLRELDRLDPAMQIMLDNLDLVARNNLKALSKLCKVDDEDIRDMIAEIRCLTPRPGSAFATDAAAPIRPDVTVRRLADGTYAIELEQEALPRVLFDKTYYAEVSAHLGSDSDRSFIAERHAEAGWLVRSLEQRARTILKVAQEIVRQQDDFFVHGVGGMRPMTLKTVAEAIEMHESTVSRVTANKYMATERGIFEMKYFFSPAIAAIGGGVYAAEAVRDRIRKLIESERPDAVYSDDQIVERLRAAGIDIARRTVAKYRESLHIPSSVQRRRQAI